MRGPRALRRQARRYKIEGIRQVFFALDSAAAMEPSSGKETKESPRRKMSPRTLNVLTALIGVGTLAVGIGWLIYSWVVDLEVPYFAIPLVMTVPVIVAVAFRNLWE
jgi:Na+/glutamate symporter